MKYTSKVDFVYELIVERIQKGIYLPGDRIIISRVAKESGCSEIPVREALRKLESENIVKILPNRGAVISRQSKSYLEQLFVVKTILESSAACMAADHILPAQLETLRALAHEMQTTYAQGNLKRCSQLNHKFHILLYSASKNEVLVSEIDALWHKWPIGRYVAEVPNDWYEISLEQHFEILDAVEANDKERISALIYSHKHGSLENLGKSNQQSR